MGAGGEGACPGAWEPAGPLALTISSAEGGWGAAPSAAGKAHTRPHPLPLSARGAHTALLPCARAGLLWLCLAILQTAHTAAENGAYDTRLTRVFNIKVKLLPCPPHGTGVFLAG